MKKHLIKTNDGIVHDIDNSFVIINKKTNKFYIDGKVYKKDDIVLEEINDDER